MKLSIFTLLVVLIAPLRATELTPWDSMGQVFGDVTVTLKSGKSVRQTSTVSFTATQVGFSHTGMIIPRQQVKDVVIRTPRPNCCALLRNGVAPLSFTISSVVEYHSPLAVVEAVLLLPVATGMAAVTGPPFLVIEGLHRLKPTTVLYRVVP